MSLDDLTADQLIAEAKRHGMTFSISPWGGLYKLSAFTPLILAEGGQPSDEARAVFAEVQERWGELERAARKKYRAERSPR
jgi:hypothetical protein